MTQYRPPCPVCHAKSGHHKRGCPRKGANRGYPRKSADEKYKKILITIAPDLLEWLRNHKRKTKTSVSGLIAQAVVAMRDRVES